MDGGCGRAMRSLHHTIIGRLVLCTKKEWVILLSTIHTSGGQRVHDGVINAGQGSEGVVPLRTSRAKDEVSLLVFWMGAYDKHNRHTNTRPGAQTHNCRPHGLWDSGGCAAGHGYSGQDCWELRHMGAGTWCTVVVNQVKWNRTHSSHGDGCRLVHVPSSGAHPKPVSSSHFVPATSRCL